MASLVFTRWIVALLYSAEGLGLYLFLVKFAWESLALKVNFPYYISLVL